MTRRLLQFRDYTKHSRKMINRIKNALSIDTEDWYQGILQIDYRDWSNYKNRIKDNLEKILSILGEYKVTATFFVLGYLAERYPELVIHIANKGHEIASHGYYHRLVYQQTKEEFRKDVLRSKEILESIIKSEIKGYRAPFFSITKDSLWALEVLKDCGFEYDSSIFPTKNFLYGIPDAPRTIYRVKDIGIIEFPLSVSNIIGIRVPVCGGFYLRALPYSLTKIGIRCFNRKGWPVVVYLHPWEIDVSKPRIPMAMKWKIIHEYNISKMENNLNRLIKDFSFTTISEVLFGN